MADTEQLLEILRKGHVRFVVIGGVAGWVHGSGLSTVDLDIVYDRRRENLERLVAVLKPLAPYLRGAPPGLPFLWDVETLERGLNFTLDTTLGPLDLLGEMAGGGRYDDLLPHSEEQFGFGGEYRFLTLPALIRAKRAAGRPKDLQAIAILEALREERDAMGG